MSTVPPAKKRPDTLTRSERKDLTRASLLQAALALIGEGRSFTSLGIREIAREAGIVPNAFYRHFRNTDDLGLALVEEMGVTLRRLLREARQVGRAPNSMVRRSVQVYDEYVRQNRLQFLFVSSERSGGSRILRLAIRTEVTHFTNEMAQDFRRLGIYPDMPTSSLQMVCGLIVTTMLAAAPEILDLPPDQPLLEAEMRENFVHQLQVVLLGAACWKEKKAGQASGAPGLSAGLF
ncbi:HTH-type transcriptional repressor FabR [Rhodoferax sp. U2-2l]|uniref:HTH-type transcriptional repressor FabR n=1 Tax=Rhodoferax sp. U2-2l TaxID=2884000 RepID=UPI001D09A292|nr:HTH-type transcriptional repressor FabR [Rhodoferax sp. U2-2l]MCB8748883.1 HTH-type transcriptional repressor FabR [Rhodoferax sp. U2-2l]